MCQHQRALPGGSSPRVWGTRHHADNGMAHFRFIPTGVGNTFRLWSIRRSRSVHPHGCGEHTTRVRTSPIRSGSSPRVWGTPDNPAVPSSTRRFIPTGVGNTTTPAACRSTTAVHPHGCGEHEVVCEVHTDEVGSSPRVWGTHKIGNIQQVQFRFIPTGVGNTPIITD